MGIDPGMDNLAATMTYHVRTTVFEGPLDLLLQLITKHELEISAVGLTGVVTEYLAFVDEMRDLDIEVKENTLTIRGEKRAEQENSTFLHRGIAARSFERRFQLADYVVVKGASLENGLLHVDLVRELPEAMKPRTIEITTKTDTDKPKVIDSKAA